MPFYVPLAKAYVIRAGPFFSAYLWRRSESWPVHTCIPTSISRQAGLDPTAAYGAEVMSFPDPFNRGCLFGPLQMFGQGQKRLGGQLVRM